jgi:tetrahydromethanopterin S-methyltransferase subunit G
MPPQSPALGSSAGLAPPPEGIYRTFDDLLSSVQRTAKEQGYSIVKLRASNYRDSKPTRYDLVCDRGGVKYSSTAKKRNPSTRKVDCPWRAKAVCEVNLGHQWRFVVQEPRHNHEARVPAAVPGQENTPVAQSLRSLTNKVDRMAHEVAQGMNRLESVIVSRLDNIEKRLEALEGGRSAMLGGNGVPQMGAPSMPPANMGGNSLGNNSLTNGGMQPLVDGRLGGVESRLGQMEPRSLDGLQMMDDDTRGLSMMVNS